MNTHFFFVLYKPKLCGNSCGSIFLRMLESSKVFATIVIEPNV